MYLTKYPWEYDVSCAVRYGNLAFLKKRYIKKNTYFERRHKSETFKFHHINQTKISVLQKLNAKKLLNTISLNNDIYKYR